MTTALTENSTLRRLDISGLEPKKSKNLDPLNIVESTVDTMAIKALQTPQSNPALLSEKNVVEEDKENPGSSKSLTEKLPLVNLTNFRPLTEEQINKMNAQELLETVLTCCFLIQTDSRRTNMEFLHTLQDTLNAVVKRLSSMQATVNWSWPSFLAIGLGGVAPMTGGAEVVLKALSGALDAVKDIVKATDDSKMTPVSSEQSQLHSTLANLREGGTSKQQEIDKILSQLEGALKLIYDLIMRISN